MDPRMAYGLQQLSGRFRSWFSEVSFSLRSDDPLYGLNSTIPLRGKI
jgi:hypothetical protein